MGIAVSYGLFSRRNHDDLERENNSKSDSAHSYMSRLLQFPSVFDDEVETPSGSDHNHDNNSNKFQTWSSRYHRNEPMLLVAKRDSLPVEKSGVGEKPLLLPVRSLKSRVSDDGNDVDSGVSRVFARSNSMPIGKGFFDDSKRMSTNTIDADFVSGEDYETSRVSNRSNSSVSSKGSSNIDSRRLSKHESFNPRITVPTEFGYVNEDDRVSNRSKSSVNSKGSLNDSRRLSRHGSFNSRVTVPTEFGYVNEDNRVSGSLRRTSSSSSSSPRGFSSNSGKASNGKYGDFDDDNMEEQEERVVGSAVLSSPIPWQSRSRKRIEPKGDHSNEPITFSPLPSMVGIEPSRSFKSQSPQSSQSNSSSSSPTKRPSPKRVSPSIPLSSESQAKNVEDLGRRNVAYSSRLPPPPPPPPPRPPMPRSRSFMSSSTWSEPKRMSRENRTKSLNVANEIEEEKVRNEVESSSVGKSVRTIRSRDTMEGARRTRDIEKETSGYDPMSKDSLSEFPKETRDFLEGLLVETDDDSESEDNEDNYGESNEIVKPEQLEEESPSDSITDEGPDVDKKADEFIAKFREQIRLQRIDSIKRSTGQLKRSSLG